MAKQPLIKRSVFQLPMIVILIIFYNCLIVQMLQIDNENYYQDSFNNNNNNGTAATTVGDILSTGSLVRKFGDRILPRHRQIVDTTSADTLSSLQSLSSSTSRGIIYNNSAVDNNNLINNNYNNNNKESHRTMTAIVTEENNKNDENEFNIVNNENNNNNLISLSRKIDDDVNNVVVLVVGGDTNHKKLNTINKNQQQNLNKYNFHTNLKSNNNIVKNLLHYSSQVMNTNNKNVSSAQAHRLEMSTEFFVVPTTTQTTTTTSSSSSGPSASIIQKSTHYGGIPILSHSNINNNSTSSSSSSPTIISTHNLVKTAGSSGIRKEPWVVPILVLASLSMFMMMAFEIFVLCKAWRTSPSRRHLFLGQMLLLGLFACAGLAMIITATPSLLSCATVRFGTGVAFALVFASLLVKCVFLISLNSGVYLPAPYQGLLLLFAVLIQVAVGGQWLLTSPPSINNISIISTIPPRQIGQFNGITTLSSSSSQATTHQQSTVQNRYPLLLTAQDITITIPLCKTPFTELLFSLIYIVFLILFVAILAIKSRGIRDNYREATYIGLAIGGSIPIWLGWILCGLAVVDRHKDACLAFGLVATSVTVFLVMFMPKGRQLAAMGKEGLYVEDREEQFSSLSHVGSGYSPSFFHFKPIKYGVMAPTTANSTGTNTVNGNHNNNNNISTKHQAVTTLGGGMFMRPDDTNIYTTLEPTMSSNPNVYFQRGGSVHPGMMY